ncbi:unnamed protein product [Sphagnum balticum]
MEAQDMTMSGTPKKPTKTSCAPTQPQYPPRYLKALSEEPEFRPRRFFSIDRVFRNETLDNTHLAEFHQVEGFIIDRNLGLNHLIGVLTEFYKKIGIEQISFKPCYNPYTEPSMEIFGNYLLIQVTTPSSSARSKSATPGYSDQRC